MEVHLSFLQEKKRQGRKEKVGWTDWQEAPAAMSRNQESRRGWHGGREKAPRDSLSQAMEKCAYGSWLEVPACADLVLQRAQNWRHGMQRTPALSLFSVSGSRFPQEKNLPTRAFQAEGCGAEMSLQWNSASSWSQVCVLRWGKWAPLLWELCISDEEMWLKMPQVLKPQKQEQKWHYKALLFYNMFSRQQKVSSSPTTCFMIILKWQMLIQIQTAPNSQT